MLIVVAAKILVPATLKFPVTASLPVTLELVMLVGPKVDCPIALSVPGVLRGAKLVMLFVNRDNWVGCPVRLA